MNLGYSQKIITPPLNTELVGFTPSRLATSVEKDLRVKVLTIVNDNKYYGWLVTDMLGLDLFFKDTVLEKLANKNQQYADLQIFTTHTHSGPTCLNKEQYFDKKTDSKMKAYFDYLVEQSVEALSESLQIAEDFTYRLNIGTMKNFQTNRQDPDKFSDKEMLVIEISFKAKEPILIYSFGGHPTILNTQSSAISPDYVGEVSKLLADKYHFNIFFNAPCGDMSTRFTRKGSDINELKRLAKIAADQVLELSNNLNKRKTLNKYAVKRITYPLKYKKFDSIQQAEIKYQIALKKYENAKTDNLDSKALRVLQSVAEGNLINLMQSKKAIDGIEKIVNISIITVDDFQIINLPSEIFSSLVQPLKADKKTWVISLSDQYSTYFCDIDAYKNQSYEAISSLFEKGEAEKMIEFVSLNK